MNKQNLTEGNVEVCKQNDICCRWSVAKNRANARKRQSTSMKGHKKTSSNSQSKLSLSNLKSANLNLAYNQMQFWNHRLRGSLNVLWRSDCLSHTLEKHEKWEMKVCIWLLKELFHNDKQTYLQSFQQQIYEILSTPWPFPRSRETLMGWMCHAQHS